MVVVSQLRGGNQVVPSMVLPSQANAVNQALRNSGNWTQIRRMNGLGNTWYEENKTMVVYAGLGVAAGVVAGLVWKRYRK